MLGITIRQGAAYHDLTTADGAVIDISKLDRPQRHKLNRLVRDIYSKHLEGK
ncbi:MAG: hypothetical protein P4M09_17385 [Devosia sp.]|nr:hypothetical protein [Devosia sp.]